jgi:putative acetyltransferase
MTSISYFERLSNMRPDAVTILKIQLDQESSMVEIIRQNIGTFEEAGSVVSSTLRRLSRFFEIYNRDDSAFLIGMTPDQNKMIGGVGIAPMAGLPASEGVAEIRDLVIAPEFRRRGIAKKLLKEILLIARQIGYTRAYLETTPQMEHAQRLFQSLSFRPVEHQRSESDTENTSTLASYYHLDDINAALKKFTI